MENKNFEQTLQQSSARDLIKKKSKKWLLFLLMVLIIGFIVLFIW